MALSGFSGGPLRCNVHQPNPGPGSHDQRVFRCSMFGRSTYLPSLRRYHNALFGTLCGFPYCVSYFCLCFVLLVEITGLLLLRDLFYGVYLPSSVQWMLHMAMLQTIPPVIPINFLVLVFIDWSIYFWRIMCLW